MEDEKLYQVALELIPGIGDINAKNLISYCGSAKGIFEAKKPHLMKIPGVGEKTVSAIQSHKVLAESEEILEKCDKHDIKPIHYTDKNYPARLKLIADGPNLIYAKGKGDFQPPRTLAIVGTRNATEYGKNVTAKLAQSCSELKATLVSGLAYGIDIQAHKSGLEAKVPNIAVLAGGLDTIYPTLHKKYAEEIEENGLLISENPPGTQPEAHFFPARNRIIAGLSDAVVIVEAARKGGALITANIADSYDKPVFAVPGDLNHKYSEGCNYLIRNQKATIYTSPADIVYFLNWDLEEQPIEKPTINLEALSEVERKVVEMLQHEQSGIAIDELAWKSQVTMNQLASILLNLEFQGLVKSLPGKKYRLG